MKTKFTLFTLSFVIGFLLTLLLCFACDVRADHFEQGVLFVDGAEAKLDPIVKQERKGPTLIVHYESGAVVTNSLYLGMSNSTKKRIQEMTDDRETLKAAKALAQSLKQSHADKVGDLSDAEIVATSKTVLDNTAESGGAGAALGFALGAAAGAAAKNKKNKKEEKAS